MSLNPEAIVYPVGHHASGKTELCSYLMSAYGFEVVETGAMVRALYASRDDEFADDDISAYVANINMREPDYFDGHLLRRVNQTDSDRVLVNGMRTYSNILALKRSHPKSKHPIVWLEIPPEVLKLRYEHREKRTLTDEEFTALLNIDSGLGLDEIHRFAEHVIVNDSTIEALRSRSDTVMKQVGVKAIKGA